MKGIVISRKGNDFFRKLTENLPMPKLEADEILVETHFGGLNFADLMMCNGTYPHPKGYPLLAGLELSGLVVECGNDVKNFVPGDRVVGFSEEAGAFSQYCKLNYSSATKIDKEISLSDAAAYFIQTTTAHHLLNKIGNIKASDIVLIHAIGGGVGLNLTQLAKLKGATVIGTVGTSGKEYRAKEYGADLVIDRNQDNFIEEIQKHYGNSPINLLIDSTGAEILDESFKLMKNLAHVVSYGEASGKPYTNLWERLVEKSLTFSRLHIGHMDFMNKYWLDAQLEIQNLIKNGKLKLFVEKVFNLDEIDELYDTLKSRKVSGKLLLKFK